jgi:D-alanine-D-alanine ligase
MNAKIKVGVIFGGRSAEHEVSIRSAKNIIEALDKEKYEPILIGIDKSGRWFLNGSLDLIGKQSSEKVTLIPQGGGEMVGVNSQVERKLDVVFPVLHGPFGEDGTIQGLLKLANIPFVGAGVLGSAIGMDKDVMKRLLRDAGIPVAKFIACKKFEVPEYSQVVEQLGQMVFVKPANLGSSIGVSKVKSKEDFDKAVKNAFLYDKKILIEETVNGREVECSILGNDEPVASVPGEIIPKHEFYTYESKYIDENGARLEIPAKLPNDIIEKVKQTSIQTFKVLECEGFARVDCFVTEVGEVLVNEINTIPGFTSISMYPKLWEASGISYSELVDKLIQLAIERFKIEQNLKTSID